MTPQDSLDALVAALEQLRRIRSNRACNAASSSGKTKALEVGLPFPWYVIPRDAGEIEPVPEDDKGLPDEE